MARRIPVFLGLLLTLALAAPIGCVDDQQVGGGAEERSEVCKSSCHECTDLAQDAYACMAFDESQQTLSGFECIVCDRDGPARAALTCETEADQQAVLYTTMAAQLVPCGDSPAAARCTGWNPNQRIRPLDDNTWNVDRDFIAAIVADSSQLIGCDDTRLRRSDGFRSSDYYQVASVDSDDLLGRLGFIDDDVIRSVNGYPMRGPFDVLLAFFELWPGTRVFTVEVHRPGVGVVTFTYNLV